MTRENDVKINKIQVLEDNRLDRIFHNVLVLFLIWDSTWEMWKNTLFKFIIP